MAASPLGAFLLLGLDITALSIGWPSLPEIKKFIRSIRMEDARAAARKALAARSAEDVTRCLTDALGDAVDLAVFSGRWSLSASR
jgi:phosphoenolpyruvate-protein kinase (PTS system EI component)